MPSGGNELATGPKTAPLKRCDQQESLRRISRAVSSREPASDILQLIAREGLLLTTASTVAIGIRSDDGKMIDFTAAAGENLDEVLGLRIRCEDSFAESSIRTGKSSAFALSSGGTSKSTTIPQEFRNAAVAPIIREGRITGALCAMNKLEGVPFAADDVRALEALADYAAITLVLAESIRECGNKSREAAVLYDAARSFGGSLNVHDVINSLLDSVSEHFQHQAAVLFLLNDERTHLFIAADRGLTDEDREIQLAADGLVTSGVMESGKPLHIQDIFAERSYESVTIPGRTRSAIVAPVRSWNDTLGLLIVSTNIPNAYSSSDVDLLGAVAAQSGVAIANAWLYEDATRRAEEATALYDLSQHVNASLHLDRVLHFVADSVVNLLKVDKFSLMLLDTREGRLVTRVCRGLDAAKFSHLRPRPGEGIAGWVLEWMTPTAVADVAADARNASCPIHGEGVVSTICVPMAVGNDEIGVMLAMSSRRRLFTVAEMELLYTIANQSAVAIANATMYQDARSKSTEMRRYFHRVARALGSALEAQDVPQLLADLVVEVMRADRCAVYRADSDAVRLQATSRFRAASPPDPMMPIGEGLAGWVARRGKPLAIEQLSEDPRARAHAWLSRERLGSYLAVPLKSGRRTVGVLEIFTQEPRKFVDEEIKLLTQFARRARVAERLVLDGA